MNRPQAHPFFRSARFKDVLMRLHTLVEDSVAGSYTEKS
jgi:hypothetical protein